MLYGEDRVTDAVETAATEYRRRRAGWKILWQKGAAQLWLDKWLRDKRDESDSQKVGTISGQGANSGSGLGVPVERRDECGDQMAVCAAGRCAPCCEMTACMCVPDGEGTELEGDCSMQEDDMRKLSNVEEHQTQQVTEAGMKRMQGAPEHGGTEAEGSRQEGAADGGAHRWTTDGGTDQDAMEQMMGWEDWIENMEDAAAVAVMAEEQYLVPEGTLFEHNIRGV